MAADSKIQWCDSTFNHVRGCTKVSAGCANCYAETLSARNPAVLGVWGPKGTRVVASEAQWREPVKWNKAAACDCHRRADMGERHLPSCPQANRPRVFCASLADVFEGWTGPMVDSSGNILIRPYLDAENKPENWDTCDAETLRSDPQGWGAVTMGDVRARLFDLIDSTPNLDWLLLTKRPENVLRMTYDQWCKPVAGHVSQNEDDGRHWHWPPNVWLGASVENQAAADERIPHLFATPAAVRFLSCEPLLGAVDLRRLPAAGTYERDALRGHYKGTVTRDFVPTDRIDWVIVGGESGPGARPMHLEWARSLVGQCKAAGVACFVKQLGAVPQWNHVVPGCSVREAIETLGLKDRKGGDPEEWPADLRVREFPACGGQT